MAKGVEIKGLKELQAKIKALPKELKEEIGFEIEASALNIVAGAKRDVPKDLGQIANGISQKKNKDLEFEIVSSAPYSPYVEFGTGKKVNVPAEFSDYALQFKGGNGGTWQEMLRAITEWIKRKGLAGTYSVKTQKRTGKKADRNVEDIALAYVIARSILANGLDPRPFFFPNIQKEEPELIKRIKAIINNS